MTTPNPNQNPDIGTRLYNARMKLDWSQQHLADEMGTARSRISAVENSVTQPTVAWLTCAANTLKISVRSLVPHNDY